MNDENEKLKKLKELFEKRNEILDKISELEQERIVVTGEIWRLQDAL